MSLYEDNLSALKRVDEALYQALLSSEDDGTILVGDAANGEQFLAVMEGENIISLSSPYCPEHAVERFLLQFQEAVEPIYIVMFGFGSGEVVRQILADNQRFDDCIVYEPSLMILRKALETYDLTTVIEDKRFRLFAAGVNDSEFYPYLDNAMDYLNWEYYQYVCLPKYRELFYEQEMSVYSRYYQVYHYRNVDQNTLIYYAKQGSDNEILSFQWLIDGKNLFDLSEYVTDQDVCIIVAAGPSLEKNVTELKKAQGKAMIFCVDSAAKTLLRHDILPDMVCTVDPEKGGSPLSDERLADIPIAITPESDHSVIEALSNPKVLCYSAGNAYHQGLFEEAGVDMPYYYGGGSVATNCFSLARDLGFRTIILIGQDLALQGDKIHVDGQQNETTKWKKLSVEGYYGDNVITLSDFKLYLDWYEAEIPQMEYCRVINATEGGARIRGACQMPLSEAITAYCHHSFDFKQNYNKMPYIWDTREKKKKLYESLKKQRDYLESFSGRVRSVLDYSQRTIILYRHNNLTEKDAAGFNAKAKDIMDEIMEGEASILLYKRMFKAELEFQHEMQDLTRISGDHDLQKMKVMSQYLSDADKNISEILTIWETLLKKIECQYEF